MLSLLVQGILIGAIYGLIALGLTLVFGIMRVINFAHGALLMVSMFISYMSVTKLGLNPYLSLIIVVPAMFAIGYLINWALIQRVLNKESDVREPIGALVLTFGLSVLIENVFLAIFGPNYHSISTTFATQTVQWGSVIVAMPKLYAFVLAVTVSIAFYVFLHKSELGRTIRAVGQSRNTALLMGVNVPRVFNMAFGIGLAVLGTAGVALIPFYNVHPSIGGIFGIKAFLTVLLGGLGSIPGALLGGLLIGIVESLCTLWVPSTLSSVVVLYAFLIFLFIRPSGLFGSRHDH
ncbi:branched-chain amino acid ABC transporter permease [Variovorax sp. E3]|uniref:branched-chain amino acid ABC transporter permease n=1 Tax=Variovorax sp. E3 TaxID=1914993 RepID=UPI0018DC2D58|nr:branched-chain amino acid ABC transporter permease [Variovorax sp. E3]